MLMGLNYDEAEYFGRCAERPDTYVLSKDDIKQGVVTMGDGVNCLGNYTTGHASDDGKPDEILRRKNLFMYYVGHVVELYPLLTNNAKFNSKKDPVTIIQAAVDWGAKSKYGDKLDGIFRFLIELEKATRKNKKEFTVSIPIKRLPDEVDTGVAWWLYSKPMDWIDQFNWDFDEAAKSQVEVLNKYLKSMYKEYEFDDPQKLQKQWVFTVRKK